MGLGHGNDVKHARLIGPHDKPGELRKDREEQAADAEMVREVAQMVLQPSAKVVGVPIGCKRVVLLERLDGVVEVVSRVALHAGHLHHDLLNLVFAPLACAVEGELARAEYVDESGEHTAAHGDDVVELVGLVYAWLPLDLVLKGFGHASVDFTCAR